MGPHNVPRDGYGRHDRHSRHAAVTAAHSAAAAAAGQPVGRSGRLRKNYGGGVAMLAQIRDREGTNHVLSIGSDAQAPRSAETTAGVPNVRCFYACFKGRLPCGMLHAMLPGCFCQRARCMPLLSLLQGACSSFCLLTCWSRVAAFSFVQAATNSSRRQPSRPPIAASRLKGAGAQAAKVWQMWTKGGEVSVWRQLGAQQGGAAARRQPSPGRTSEQRSQQATPAEHGPAGWR